ncbi:diaminobutyrate acetyltransferase [Rhodococcus hoagii]|nr:diaminobutyrate acetyltransferase [Prescottella equi]
MTPTQLRNTPTTVPDAVEFRKPQISDGVRLWEIAKDSQVLDLNSSYSYLLWCRDFQDTSIVATADDRVVGFVTGYVRPEVPATLFVWQVAVDEDQRGADWPDACCPTCSTMLRCRVSGSSRPPSSARTMPHRLALFTSVAHRRGCEITKSELFSPQRFSRRARGRGSFHDLAAECLLRKEHP